MTIDLGVVLKKISGIGADWWGVREVSDKVTTLFVRDERPETSSLLRNHGIMIEARINGQFGYAATQDLSDAALIAAAKLAASNARSGSAFRLFAFDDSHRPIAVGEYRSPQKTPLDSLTTEHVISKLMRACKNLKVSDKIVKREVFTSLVQSDVRFVSSTGSNVWQHFNLVASHMGVVAKEGTNVQRRTRNGPSTHTYQIGAEFFDNTAFEDAAEGVATQAIELLSAPECPTGTKTLVLAPDQMILQIHESIGHPLELDRVLGDERNYAGFSFVRPHDFGTLKYGSKLMNVTFDPTVSEELASYAFDECGNPAKREFLIKDGTLLRGLGSLESQARLKQPGVANFRATSWNRAPIDRMANINLEPGVSTFDEIISSIEDGVFMESNKSWSIDDYRNKFQFGCERARRIKDGKLGEVLKNPNYRGSTTAFWNNLSKVGNVDTMRVFGVSNCGKGEPNQSIRVGHGSPVCAFENIEVFGGAV